MGEYAELAIAHELEMMTNEEFFLKSRSPIWETINGSRIKIKDMTTSHIDNSLAKCKRDNWRVEFIPHFEYELQKRKKQ